MKLSQLADRSGASTASIKFWIRSGILPPGELRNQTTAVYGERHIERIALIQTLRSEFDASTEGIRALTDLIDAPDAMLLDIMQACQVLATGMVVAVEPEHAQSALIGQLQERMGWLRFDSLASSALAGALADSARVGYAYDLDDLVHYAEVLEPIAVADIGSIHPEGTPDVVARNVLVAAAAQHRVLVAMNQLAHTATAIRAATGG